MLASVRDWPAHSPGSANAWLLLVTTKEPSWRDPLLAFPAEPPVLGAPHPGFYYPDPLGFWAEIRRWATVLHDAMAPGCDGVDALAITALVHLGDGASRLADVRDRCRPRMVLFLDHAAFGAVADDVTGSAHHIADPHRAGQVYEGFWGRDPSGATVGCSPQHPSTHRLYRAADLTEFLRAAPRPTG